jgi:hypothetical protein
VETTKPQERTTKPCNGEGHRSQAFPPFHVARLRQTEGNRPTLVKIALGAAAVAARRFAKQKQKTTITGNPR